MPVKKGGKKNKKYKKKPVESDEANRVVPTAQDGQMYALADKMLGSRRLTVMCADRVKRLAIIPGKFKGKRHWIEEGMVLLVGIRSYQEEKVDVIYIYTAQDAKHLQRKGELDDLLDDKEKDCGFVFGGPEDDAEIDLDNLDIEIDLDDL